jgi:hypothetical protein
LDPLESNDSWYKGLNGINREKSNRTEKSNVLTVPCKVT